MRDLAAVYETLIGKVIIETARENQAMTDTRSAFRIRKDVIAMTTQHTPGPYIIDADPDNEGFLSIYTATDGINAELAGKIGERSNADLFAAAPETAAERDRLKAVNAELVKALNLCAQELADAYHTLDFTDIPEHPARKVFDQACAVLTKATGTSVSINSPAFAEQPEAQANAASWPSGPRKRAKAKGE